MVFSSPIFLFLFLPVVLFVYHIAGGRFKNLTLFFSSLLFYAWGEPVFVLLMLFSIIINYFIGIKTAYNREKNNMKTARRWMITGVSINLFFLVVFKYTNFIADNINLLTGRFHIGQIRIGEVILPLGISFFTFQILSYIIDVYKGRADVQKNIFDLGLYISLFPQLIAGPIVRYRDIQKQIRGRDSSVLKFSSGMRRFIIGLGKKILIANIMAEVADGIFEMSPGQLNAPVAWAGLIAYTLQIYFDFSGYSDMAIGLGKMFGFTFLENFNYPYISASIREFWRRWHISLSNWFKDYLYIPLGGNRKGKLFTYRNLLLVFFLCGLWHGASWNFVVWGLFHGVFLVVERMKFGKTIEKLYRPLQTAYTLLVVMAGWVFFRAVSFGHAMDYFVALGGFRGSDANIFQFMESTHIIAMAAGIVFSIPVIPWIIRKQKSLPGKITGRGLCIARDIILIFILFASAMSMASGTYNPFIYFRF